MNVVSSTTGNGYGAAAGSRYVIRLSGLMVSRINERTAKDTTDLLRKGLNDNVGELSLPTRNSRHSLKIPHRGREGERADGECS